ncbi:MAG: DUF3300 domain-containing protein, partial [Burkholderiales bacterium]|nr:DUF3300 domain-containing protein [Burkholderiales bacterium]
MTMQFFAPKPARSGGPRWPAVMAAFVALVFATNLFAQAPAASVSAPAARSPEELEKLVDRIALYPDDLVAIILPASTNPLQLVQAERFLEKRKADPKLQVDEKWDDAVKSLLNYPEVVKSMSDDLDWTSELGEAVVEDQGAVLEAVQVFRRKTQSAGNLKSDDKQTVVVEKEVITIVPADPQVIYVPQYNPTTVVVSGGYSSWGYYPSPYPVYYYPYPPGAALATGIIWGAAIGAVWNGGRYGANYGGGNNNININRNTNINTGNINTGNVNRGGSSGGSSQWKSNKQPGQVSSSTGRTQSTRSASTRPGGSSGSTGAARGSGASAGAARPSAQPSGGGAFGGANTSGRQTQMDSSRGAAS